MGSYDYALISEEIQSGKVEAHTIDELKEVGAAIALDDRRAILFEQIYTYIAKAEGIGKTAIKKQLRAEAQSRKTKMVPDEISGWSMPEGYYLENGKLYKTIKDGYQIICDYFVVNEIHQTSDKKETVFSLLFPSRGRTILIDSEEFVDPKKLELKLINNGIHVGETVSKFKSYLNSFVNYNEENIKRVILTSSTGWQVIESIEKRDGRMVRVSKKRYCNPITEKSIEYVDAIAQKIYKKGNAEEALEILHNGLKYRGSALSILSSLAATLVAPLKDQGLSNFITNFAGTTGMGKTLSARIGLSMFGSPVEGGEGLAGNMNSTVVGNEIKFNTYKDMPILLDEAGTTKGSAEVKARAVLDTIFQFFSAQGRTRSKINLKLRDETEFRGVLLLTMEYDLKTIEKMAKTQEKGYFRRTIEVFTDTPDFLPPKEIFDFGRINMTHGYISEAFINTILKNLDAIREDYTKWEGFLSRSEMRGKEKYFAVLFATLDHLLRLGLIDKKVYSMSEKHLHAVYADNLEIMREITEKAGEKWIGKLVEFISINQSYFDGQGIQISGKKLGYIKENKMNEEEVLIYPGVLENFLVEEGINQRAFLKEMWERGLLKAEQSKGKIKYTIKRMGIRFFVFKKEELFCFEEPEESFEVIAEQMKKVAIESKDESVSVISIEGEDYDVDDPHIDAKLKEGFARSKNKKIFVSVLMQQSDNYTAVYAEGEPVEIQRIPF